MRPYRSFADQVAERLGDGKPNLRGPFLELGPTPACLRMLGFPELPLRMSPSVFWKIYTGKNGERLGLSQRQLAKLPELLDDPTAVLASATVVGALVVFTTATIKGGCIVASLEGNAREGNSPINIVTSAYAKDRESWLPEQIAAGRLRFLGEKKGPGTLDVSGITLNRDAEPGSQNPQDGTILFADDLRNFRDEQRQKKLTT